MGSSEGLSAGPEVWSLAQVYAECTAAVAVWFALLWLAIEQGSFRVATSRNQLAKLTGINRFPTLSRALSTLEEAGWIKRTHILTPSKHRLGLVTLLQVSLNREHFAFFIQAGDFLLNKERKTFSSLKKREISLSDGEQKTFSIRETENVLYPLVQEAYRAMDIQTISSEMKQVGIEILSEMLELGRTVEEIRLTIAWVRDNKDNPRKIDRPPSSLRFLPRVIDKAVKEARSNQKAQEQKRRRDEDEARRIAALDEEATLHMSHQKRNGTQ